MIIDTTINKRTLPSKPNLATKFQTVPTKSQELEDYRRFIFIDTLLDTSINKRIITIKPNIPTKLQIVQTESQGPELQTEATKSITTESIATELKQLEPEVETQEDNNASHSKGKEPMLAKYVRRHHTLNQIIGENLKVP